MKHQTTTTMMNFSTKTTETEESDSLRMRVYRIWYV